MTGGGEAKEPQLDDVARAMMIREASASTRLDRGDDGTIDLGPVDNTWRVCGACEMPYQDTEPARRAHAAVKGHAAVDSGPWAELDPPAEVSPVPRPGRPWDGLEWDADVQGWVVKDAPDGRRVWVVRYMFTSAIIIGPPDAWEYDDRWCYTDTALATACARAWSAEPGTEPEGWHRHPTTGRRRPDGDPANEHLMP